MSGFICDSPLMLENTDLSQQYVNMLNNGIKFGLCQLRDDSYNHVAGCTSVCSSLEQFSQQFVAESLI